MPRLTRLFLVLVATFSSLATARAEGLVQLSLRGSLETPGGAPVELRWATHSSVSGAKEAGLRLHLAQGTSAHTLATLIAGRLRKVGAQVVFPAERTPSAQVHLFVEDTILVSLRLAPGLSSSITTCESAPSRVRLMKPLLYRQAAGLTVSTSTFHAHTQLPGGVLLKLELPAALPTAQISEQLFEESLAKGLVGDRPSADSWRPVRGEDGAAITGCSIVFASGNSDWGLEVQLAAPLPR